MGDTHEPAASAIAEAPPVSLPSEPERVVSRARAYVALSFGTLGATGIVALVARPPTAPWWCIGALLAQTVLLWLAAGSMRLPQTTLAIVLRGAFLGAVGLLAGPSAWFWGPNGPFAAFIVLVLLFAGVLSEPGVRGRIGIAVYVTLAVGQAAPVALVLAGVLDDRSLVPLLLPGHAWWHHAAGHAAIQAMYLAAFLAGHALQRRYASVASAIETSIRATSLRDALLEEARAEYRRAVAASRARAIPSALPRTSSPPPALKDGDTDVAPRVRSVPPPAASVIGGATPTPTPMPSDAAPARAPTEAAIPPVDTSDAWRAAYQSRTRGEQALLFSMGIIGSALLGVVGPGAVPVAVGCIGILLIALLASYARAHERARTWAWTLVGALSAMPAYAVGLHSGFACVVACVLFFGSAFDASEAARTPAERLLRTYGTMAACMLAHLTLFVLIATGVVPDAGNAPTFMADQARFEPYVMHGLVEFLYVAAFGLGYGIDRRYRALVAGSRAAARETARREAQLKAATADVARAMATSEALFVGETMGGYRLEKLLASGGMGEVYEAVPKDDPGGERVAVKVLRRDRAHEPLSLALFEEEAAVLGRVTSPFVAKVQQVSAPDAELPYLVMELIDGATLATILRARHHLSEDEVRALVRDVAEGLRAVHAAGIIHRDLKPHNVMLTTSREGARWKIVDFGVAQLHDLVSAGAALVAGTPSYMAPEQALGERIDARADLYALGLVAYRALAGRPAFVGDDAIAIATAARSAGPPDPKLWVTVSRDVERVLRLGLAARPADRFATAAEMKKAFESAFAGTLDDRIRKRADKLLELEPWSLPRATTDVDVPTRRSMTPTRVTTGSDRAR